MTAGSCSAACAATTGGGVARAFLSDGYKIIDNLDVLLAALDGVRASGFPVRIAGCDLTERRMYVRVVCEQVARPGAAAAGRVPQPVHRGVRGGQPGRVRRVHHHQQRDRVRGVHPHPPPGRAGVRQRDDHHPDATRAVHLGERLDEGVVTWSGNTLDKVLALITAKTTDSVAAFLDPAYVERAVRAMEKNAGHPVADPQETIETVSQRLRFTDAQQHDILDHFIRGGDITAGGVMHAVTSAAQIQDDADTAYEMESAALRALDLTAAL